MRKTNVHVALMKTYEVIYIHKYTDAMQAELVRLSLKERFNLTERKLELMSCGSPVVVKKGVPYAEACLFEDAIKQAGGTCWIQECSPDGLYHDRRDECRRERLDRRDSYRTSSIQPDRRMGIGRRDQDKRH